MGVFKGKRPGRQRGVAANVGTFKLTNELNDDVNLTVSYWFTGTTGNYVLYYGGQFTSSIEWDDNAAAVEAALEALSTITAVTVTGAGTKVNPFKILFVTPGDTLTPVTYTNALVDEWQDATRSSG